MQTGSNPRFDAQTIGCLTTVNGGQRFEMQFCDADGQQIVVSLPIAVAVEMGCMICEVSERAPYLVGGVRRIRTVAQ